MSEDVLLLQEIVPDDNGPGRKTPAATAQIKVAPLKSAQFRREREANWRMLESLLEIAEKQGLRALSGAQLVQLPSLYRDTLSALSVARSISLDRNLVTYLETLAARAYFQIYGPRQTLGQVIGLFLRETLPAAIRALRRPIWLATTVLLLGVGSGYLLTLANVDWFYSFVDTDLAAGRDPSASTAFLEETLFDPPPETGLLAVFASVLFTHNAKVTLASFALGIAFGVPTVLLLFGNGLMIGAMLGLFASRGLGLDMLGWLWIHGTTEIFAVILGGAAGCAIGNAVLFPGEKSRLDSLADTGRRAGIVAMGATLMLFVAGGLEGIGRQIVTDTVLRFGIGSFMLLLWLLYFNLAGTGKEPAARTSDDR